MTLICFNILTKSWKRFFSTISPFSSEPLYITLQNFLFRLNHFSIKPHHGPLKVSVNMATEQMHSVTLTKKYHIRIVLNMVIRKCINSTASLLCALSSCWFRFTRPVHGDIFSMTLVKGISVMSIPRIIQRLHQSSVFFNAHFTGIKIAKR